MPFAKILCPVDFSEPARAALKMAAQLAAEHDSELVIAHAWEAPLHPEYSELMLKNEILESTRKKEEDCLAALKRDAEGYGAKRVQTKLLFGVPWHAVVKETVDDDEIDLVVMGTHGRSGIKQVLLGSVAERVARHASCPVLLARPRATR